MKVQLFTELLRLNKGELNEEQRKNFSILENEVKTNDFFRNIFIMSWMIFSVGLPYLQIKKVLGQKPKISNYKFGTLFIFGFWPAFQISNFYNERSVGKYLLNVEKNKIIENSLEECDEFINKKKTDYFRSIKL